MTRVARQANTALDEGTPDVVYFGVPLHRQASKREPNRIPATASEFLSDVVWPSPCITALAQARLRSCVVGQVTERIRPG